MELSIQEMQAYQLEMLDILVDVCEKNNIQYLLHAGNALGAIRHGGPIPWDYDTDILVPENNIDKLCEFLPRALGKKFWLDYNGLDRSSKRHFPRIALSGYESEVLHIDIFRLIGFPENRKKQEWIYKKGIILHRLLKFKRTRKGSTPFKTFLLSIITFPIPVCLMLKVYSKYCKKYPYEQSKYAAYIAGTNGTKNIHKREIYDNYMKVNYSGLKVRIVKNYDFFFKQLYGDYMQLPQDEERERIMQSTYVVKEVQ